MQSQYYLCTAVSTVSTEIHSVIRFSRTVLLSVKIILVASLWKLKIM